MVHNSFFVCLFLHVSGNYVPIIRRNNCINTISGICHSVWMTVWYAGWDAEINIQGRNCAPGWFYLQDYTRMHHGQQNIKLNINKFIISVKRLFGHHWLFPFLQFFNALLLSKVTHPQLHHLSPQLSGTLITASVKHNPRNIQSKAFLNTFPKALIEPNLCRRDFCYYIRTTTTTTTVAATITT
jgi:hypothetical protein